MADFYRVNGTVGTLGTFVSLIGKQPAAYGIKLVGASGPGNVYTETGPNDALAGIFRTISANATILAYQVENAASASTPANVSIMLEAPNTFSATDLQNIIRGGGNGAGYAGGAEGPGAGGAGGLGYISTYTVQPGTAFSIVVGGTATNSTICLTSSLALIIVKVKHNS